MIVVDWQPVPIYEVECHECHSKIQYRKSEVVHSFITCPVCGVSVGVYTICPVRFEPPEEAIERVVDQAMSDLPERLYGV